MNGVALGRGQVVEQMAERDPAGALRFIGQMPAGGLREDALNTVVQQLALTDPKSAAGYLGSWVDGTITGRCLVRLR